MLASIGTCRYKMKKAKCKGRGLKPNLKYKKINRLGECGKILTGYVIKKVYLPYSL